MPIRRLPARKKPEPTIALINVVFLMLIFFLIAGSLAPPLDRDVRLVATEELEGRAPPDAAVVLADGTLRWRGQVVTEDQVVAHAREIAPVDLPEDEKPDVRLVPDRDLPAETLLRINKQLREAGAGKVWLITERGLQ